jgi:hypothetical protein
MTTRTWMLLSLSLLGLTLPAFAQDEEPAKLTRVQATRRVLAAIVAAAKERGERKGDALTVLYIRAAAAEADRLPPDVATSAFLRGLGLGLDDSTILSKTLLTAQFCKDVESAAERKARLAVLGSPTMQTRRDWTQHFVVSCFLTDLLGPQLAEAAGVYKEQRDSAPGGSGFSFGDLNADLAGITFAVRLKNGDLKLANLARRYEINAYLPEGKGLREELSAAQFKKDYGSLEDERYKKEVATIRKRIDELPIYQK